MVEATVFARQNRVDLMVLMVAQSASNAVTKGRRLLCELSRARFGGHPTAGPRRGPFGGASQVQCGSLMSFLARSALRVPLR